ncbi:uncharacterized protein CTHT_0027270 [Thermochaetoides thermophila DSM 1495]|uniref:Uncharacterized protein n=1 Tax=Chaetomium thermophilum (strain DSM 1495 / CBS 144.50 / IMI 039719) TaxID=759272 RepID=G0S6Y1_CHATD|nr:hypothetical protein CTHT_0027270 [Thermochaetoides thermophila DSM 1495]EGS20889.1 hypothetical protein CTHT_0027270 [Thermochaetoides thermophila DSM 1495]
MASQHSPTPVKVPAAAANYTPATLDQDLRSQINSLLIKEGHVAKIQEHLLHHLHAHPSNWPTVVQNHALSLLRSGEVTSFPALLRRVVEDVRQDTALAPSSTTANGNGESTTTNGATNGKGATTNGNKGGVADLKPSLAVPQSVVEEALKVTRECLDQLCEIEEPLAA